jgi:hypothetical protein
MQMGFGKNKRLSAPRPKKKKVEAREEAIMAASENENPQEIACEDAEVSIHPAKCAGPRASPGGIKRKQAEEELEDLYVEYYVRDELSSDADKELSVHQRLYDAKMRRIDEAQRRKQRGSAFGELERIYKAELELLQARLRSAEAEASAHNAEANWLAQQCRVLRLDSAKQRRLLRKHGVRM